MTPVTNWLDPEFHGHVGSPSHLAGDQGSNSSKKFTKKRFPARIKGVFNT